MVSAYTTFVGAAAMAAAAAALSVRSAKSTRTPNRANVPASSVRVEPYAANGATTRSPA